MTDPIAIVLTGGRSSRFGSDKASVALGGETVLARLLRLLAELKLQRAVGGGDQPVPEGVVRVADLEPGGGPVQAIAAAAAVWPDQPLLVLACDLPLVSAELLAWLARPLAAGSEARVPRLGGFPQPLAALYGPSAVATFARAHRAGVRAVQRVVAELASEWVDEVALAAAGLDAGQLRDFDTQGQLGELSA